MTTIDEAQAAIARLQASFPQWRIPASTVESWTRLLASTTHELVDALVAVDQLALSARRQPTMAEWIDAIRLAKAARMAEQPALAERPGMSFGEFLRQNPEYRERAERIGLIIEPVERETLL